MSTKWFLAILAAIAMLFGASALPTSAEAQRFRYSFTQPYNFVSIDPCSGELIQFFGELEITIHGVMDAGGGYRDHYQLVPHVRAQSLSSGTQYVVVGGAENTFHSDSADRFNESGTSTYNLISGGQAANFVEHSDFMFKYQDGQFNFHDNFRTECRG